MWDLPRPGLEPVSPALAGRFSTTAPPGKAYNSFHSFALHLSSLCVIICQLKDVYFRWSLNIFLARSLHQCQSLEKHTWIFSRYRKLLPWCPRPTSLQYILLVSSELSNFISQAVKSHTFCTVSSHCPWQLQQTALTSTPFFLSDKVSYLPPNWHPPTPYAQPPSSGPFLVSPSFFFTAHHKCQVLIFSHRFHPLQRWHQQLPEWSELCSLTSSIKSLSAHPSSVEWFAVILVLQEN